MVFVNEYCCLSEINQFKKVLNLQYYVISQLQKEKQMMRNGAMDIAKQKQKNPKQETQISKNLDLNLKTLL